MLQRQFYFFIFFKEFIERLLLISPPFLGTQPVDFLPSRRVSGAPYNTFRARTAFFDLSNNPAFSPGSPNPAFAGAAYVCRLFAREAFKKTS